MSQENKAFDVQDFLRRVGAIGDTVYATKDGTGWNYGDDYRGTPEEVAELEALWQEHLPKIRAYLIEHVGILGPSC